MAQGVPEGFAEESSHPQVSSKVILFKIANDRDRARLARSSIPRFFSSSSTRRRRVLLSGLSWPTPSEHLLSPLLNFSSGQIF